MRLGAGGVQVYSTVAIEPDLLHRKGGGRKANVAGLGLITVEQSAPNEAVVLEFPFPRAVDPGDRWTLTQRRKSQNLRSWAASPSFGGPLAAVSESSAATAAAIRIIELRRAPRLLAPDRERR